MPAIIEGPPGPDDPSPPLARRIGWFLAIAAASAGLVAVAAYGMRALLLH